MCFWSYFQSKVCLSWTCVQTRQDCGTAICQTTMTLWAFWSHTHILDVLYPSLELLHRTNLESWHLCYRMLVYVTFFVGVLLHDLLVRVLQHIGIPPTRSVGSKITNVLRWPTWYNDQRALSLELWIHLEFSWNTQDVTWLPLSFTKSGKFLVIVSSMIIFFSILPLLSFCDSNYTYVRILDIIPQVTESLSLSTIFSFHFPDRIISILLSSSSLIFLLSSPICC